METPPHKLILQRPILAGSHADRNGGLCAMEMVAWLAGEPHSDGPRCACPVIAAYVRAFNDLQPDDTARERRLRPMIPRLVNTRGSRADERTRGLLLVDHTVRVFAPLALLRRGMADEARELRELPPVVDAGSARQAGRALAQHGGVTKAATWVARRAAAGMDPASWAAAVARVARDSGSPRGWDLASELLVALIEAPARRASVPSRAKQYS